METKTGKRIVSRKVYLKMIGIKFWLVIYSFGLGAFGLYSLKMMWQMVHGRLPILMMCLFVLMVPLVCWMAYLICTSLLEVKRMDIGVPLTRANIADLPVPDSLVRASSEPLQAHEAVLLRAAAEGMERHEEDLMRASVGGE